MMLPHISHVYRKMALLIWAGRGQAGRLCPLHPSRLPASFFPLLLLTKTQEKVLPYIGAFIYAFNKIKPTVIVDKIIEAVVDAVVPGQGAGESTWFWCHLESFERDGARISKELGIPLSLSRADCVIRRRIPGISGRRRRSLGGRLGLFWGGTLCRWSLCD